MFGHSFMLKIKDRHRAYLDLWDAFQKQGCPVCALAERHYQRDINEINNESAHSLEEDMVHRETLFLCHRHIREIWAVGFPAIKNRIMEDFLRIEEDDLKEILHKCEESSSKLIILQKLQWKKSPSNHLLKRMKSCRLCWNMVHIEEHYLKALLHHIADFDFSTEFKRSAGICFPHMVKAVATFPYHGNLLFLIKTQIEKIQSLRKELSETKHHSRQAVENAEIDFRQRVLEMIAGKQGAFSGEMVPGDDSIGKMNDHFSPPLFIDESTEEEGNKDLEIIIEKLKFEKEKLCRQNENLRNDYMEESARAASLHHRYWECNEDNKRLKMNLVGAQAKAGGYAEHIERLNREIEKLQELLKIYEKKM